MYDRVCKPVTEIKDHAKNFPNTPRMNVCTHNMCTGCTYLYLNWNITKLACNSSRLQLPIQKNVGCDCIWSLINTVAVWSRKVKFPRTCPFKKCLLISDHCFYFLFNSFMRKSVHRPSGLTLFGQVQWRLWQPSLSQHYHQRCHYSHSIYCNSVWLCEKAELMHM